jgi:hypothetical protein
MAIKVGQRVKVVDGSCYDEWIGVVEDVNDDPADDEPIEVYFEFCDGFAYFKESDLVIEEVD